MGQRSLHQGGPQLIEPVEGVQRVDGSGGVRVFARNELDNGQSFGLRAAALYEEAPGSLPTPKVWAGYFARKSGVV